MTWKKKLNRLLNIIMGAFAGVFIGTSVYRYIDWRNHPGFYEFQSAPWYLSIEICGVLTAIVIVVCLIVKLIINRKSK